MKEIDILTMKKEHIEQVLEIEKLSFSIQWSEEAFTTEVTHNQLARYLVVIEDNKVIGYGGMWFILGEAHITNIAIHPEYRGRGRGRQLIEALIKMAAQENIFDITLEVRISNTSAINLYKSLGFEAVGIRKEFYYDNKEDALIMWSRGGKYSGSNI